MQQLASQRRTGSCPPSPLSSLSCSHNIFVKWRFQSPLPSTPKRLDPLGTQCSSCFLCSLPLSACGRCVAFSQSRESTHLDILLTPGSSGTLWPTPNISGFHIHVRLLRIAYVVGWICDLSIWLAVYSPVGHSHLQPEFRPGFPICCFCWGGGVLGGISGHFKNCACSTSAEACDKSRRVHGGRGMLFNGSVYFSWLWIFVNLENVYCRFFRPFWNWEWDDVVQWKYRGTQHYKSGVTTCHSNGRVSHDGFQVRLVVQVAYRW